MTTYWDPPEPWYDTSWEGEWVDGEALPFDPVWCAGCGAPETGDPCACDEAAAKAVDDLGVPFRAPDPVIHAGLLDSLLDNEPIDR